MQLRGWRVRCQNRTDEKKREAELELVIIIDRAENVLKSRWTDNDKNKWCGGHSFSHACLKVVSHTGRVLQKCISLEYSAVVL